MRSLLGMLLLYLHQSRQNILLPTIEPCSLSVSPSLSMAEMASGRALKTTAQAVVANRLNIASADVRVGKKSTCASKLHPSRPSASF